MIDTENKIIILETRLMHSIVKSESDFDLTGYKVYQSGLTSLNEEIDFDADVELIDCSAYNINLGPNVKADALTLARNTKKTFPTEEEEQDAALTVEITNNVLKSKELAQKHTKKYSKILKENNSSEEVAGALSGDDNVVELVVKDKWKEDK